MPEGNVVLTEDEAIDGQGENGLGNDHGGRRIEHPHKSKRATARQQEIDDQADNHRWEAHKRIHAADRKVAAGKALETEQAAERQAEQRGENERKTGYLQGQEDDPEKDRVHVKDEPESFVEPVQERIHRNEEARTGKKEGHWGYQTFIGSGPRQPEDPI